MGKNVRLNLILLFALSLRFVSLNQSLWLDEAIQVQAVTGHSLKSLFNQYFPGDFNPPLSYLISYFLTRILGTNELILRLPSVIFGIANVWLVYLLVEKILPKAKITIGKIKLTVSELAALFLATSPLHIYYSQEARPYILACFLGTWSIYEFWKLYKEKGNPLAYLISTALLLYSHYLAWFLLPVQLIFALIFKPKLIKSRFIFLWGLVLVLLAPWLPIMASQIRTGQGVVQSLPAWTAINALSFKNLALIPIKFIIGRISVDNNLAYGLLAIPLILFFSFALAKTFKKAKPFKNEIISLFWLWLSLPLALAVLVSLKIPLLQYFRFLYLLPALYILLTIGITKFKKSYQPLIVIFILIINLTCALIYLSTPKFQREDWRKMVSFIQIRDPKPVVVILKPVQAPFVYYDQNKSEIVNYQEIEKIRFEKGIWLVKYAQPIFEPQNQTEEKLKKYGFIQASENHFQGVTVKYFINPTGLTAIKPELVN